LDLRNFKDFTALENSERFLLGFKESRWCFEDISDFKSCSWIAGQLVGVSGRISKISGQIPGILRRTSRISEHISRFQWDFTSDFKDFKPDFTHGLPVF